MAGFIALMVFCVGQRILPAFTAVVRGDAAIVEYPADVCRTRAPHNWMYSSRFQRGSRLSGICQLGVVRIAGLGAARIGGDLGLRHEYFWHVHSRAESRAETAPGRGDKLGTFIHFFEGGVSHER